LKVSNGGNQTSPESLGFDEFVTGTKRTWEAIKDDEQWRIM
jgi:hypothetical protein